MKSNGTAPGEQGKRFLSTSIPTSPIRRNTTPPPTDGDNSTGIIIGATIGGIILFILIVILFVFYTKRKRRHLNRSQSQGQHSNDFTDLHINGSIESGQHNPGLDASVQEIYKGPEKALEAAVIDDTLPETEKEETSKNLIHNISIKLLTTWSDIYTMIDSDQYIRMKQHVEDSMETVYSPYKGFESATLLKFREGSVIADIQLRFDAGVIEPLLVLEKAIRAGRCADLEVDKNYFCIITPNLETIDGFSKKRMIEKQRIESGYYEGTDFDEHHPNKLSLKQRNGHSTKSTESKESMTSEMGSSYVSSTNISIYSGAEEDSHDITIHLGHKKKTGLLPHFTKHYGSRKMDGGGNSLKGKSNNGLQMGVPHIALFDFQPQDYRELKLTRGELVEVTSVDSGGWAKAVNKEKKFGWVPQNFISPIEPKKYQEIKMKTEAIHTLAGLDVALGADEEEECYHVPHSIPKPLHHKSDSDCSEEISQLFITIYPFEPNQIETESTSNELKLEVGDLIDVLKTNETGWWKGRCLRTEDEGWFPSSYVKPYMPEVIEEEKSIALSDTEVIRRAAESSILKTKPIDGYSSDNGEVRTKMLRENSTTSKDVEDSNNAEAAPDITAKKESVILRPKKGSPKERAVSLYIDTEMPTTKIQSPAPLTPPPRLSNHRDHGTEKAFAVPPSKPVPPPPRQKHIEKEYSHLVASGRLGSQDSLKTVSTECLASLGGRSPRKRGSDRRRNSEEISKTNIDDVVRRYQDPAKLNRIRPKSFQAPETPKSSFLSLVTKMHQQSSIKSALSLPSLVGDQMKLSPDDDRPFLDPIPRKAKSRSFVGSNATIGLFSERNCSSMKDLSQAGTIESNWLQRHHLKQSSLTDISRDSMRSASATSLSSSTNDLNVMKKPLPPEPNESEADELRSSLTSKSFQGMGLSHHGLGPNSMMSQLLRPPLISQKPVAPPRSSSKNNNAKKLIEEQRSRQGGSGLLSEHYSRAPFVYGRLRQHISFESINEESEQASTPKDETVKLPGDHDHRRSRSEPHERILQNEARSFTLSGRKLTETEISSPVSEQPESDKTLRPMSIEDSDSRIQVACDELGVRTLTYDSRVSSLQSLTSVGSSIRSTVSSKHEQQNLRRAIMNVHGQGAYDLSYKVGAIVYECRPKNKNGLCYGILDDSTEGWYPAESVEHFYMDQQL